MLKWFNKYYKVIMVIAATLLVISFVIVGALDQFMPDPKNEAIGYLDGRKVTHNDLASAELELALIKNIHPILSYSVNIEPMQWFLAQQEASRLGLDASYNKVAELLVHLNNMPIGQQQAEDPLVLVTGVAEQFKIKPIIVENALRKWLTYQSYAESIRGLAHTPLNQRINSLAQLFQYYYQAQGATNQFQRMQLQLLASRLAGNVSGKPRLHQKLASRFAWQDSEISIKTVAISADPKQGKMDQSVVEALFETYKDKSKDRNLSEYDDYAFGYRQPNQVKFSFLKFPVEQAKTLSSVKHVETKTLLAYYEANKAEFTGTFSSVRETIRERLIHERAQEKLRDLVQQTRSTAIKALTGIPQESSGYYELDEKALKLASESMRQAVEVMSTEGFKAEWQEINTWQTAESLSGIKDIGTSLLFGRQIPFANYVMSAKVFIDTPNDTLLQVGVPSRALKDEFGNLYLFVITEAKKEQAASSIEQVKSEIEENAKVKSAYESLIAKQQEILTKARRYGLSQVARDHDTKVEVSDSFQQRQSSFMGGKMAPDIKGVGRDQTFTDALFDYAFKYASDPNSLLSPVTIIPVKNQAKLFVVEILSFTPPESAMYQSTIKGGEMLDTVRNELLVRSQEELEEIERNPEAADVEDLMSEKAIAKRLDFKNTKQKPWGSSFSEAPEEAEDQKSTETEGLSEDV